MLLVRGGGRGEKRGGEKCSKVAIVAVTVIVVVSERKCGSAVTGCLSFPLGLSLPTGL